MKHSSNSNRNSQEFLPVKYLTLLVPEPTLLTSVEEFAIRETISNIDSIGRDTPTSMALDF